MAADQLTDKEDQFKRRARRRLVGAVALVLLMVTVLPMVLDDLSGQKALQPEISISIPSQDGKEFTSRIVPVGPQSATTLPAPISIASPVEKPVESAPVKPAETPKSQEQQQPAESKPAAKSVEKASVTAVVEPLKEAKPAKPEAVKPVPAESKPKAAEMSSSQAIKKGSISVQIGVFSDAAKVKQMRTKIAEQGVHCYTENMDTPKGLKYRVRCGPYADKPSAQQALDMLKATGYNGILVTNQ
jgi:DedD protein